MRLVPPASATALILVLGLVTGCLGLGGQSPKTEFYMLTPMAERASADGPGPVLAVGPVDLPGYLERPQIVTRGPGNAIELAEFEHWAEPLDESFLRVLAEDLAAQVPTDRLLLFYTSTMREVDFQVRVDVVRFDADERGAVQLVARWRLYATDQREELASRESRIAETAKPGDYDAIAGAMSRAVNALAREIAEEIRRGGG